MSGIRGGVLSLDEVKGPLVVEIEPAGGRLVVLEEGAEGARINAFVKQGVQLPQHFHSQFFAFNHLTYYYKC